MKGWQKLVCRASVVAGITFLSMMIYNGYPPSVEALYISALNFGLSFLFFINTAFENNDFDGDGKSDTECKSKEKMGEQLKSAMNGKKLKGLIGCMPNLWFP